MRSDLELLEFLLETYNKLMKSVGMEFICSVIDVARITGRIDKEESSRLHKFMQNNRPVDPSMIGCDEYVNGRSYSSFWAHIILSEHGYPITNYQSRINFLEKHIERLREEK